MDGYMICLMGRWYYTLRLGGSALQVSLSVTYFNTLIELALDLPETLKFIEYSK